jgi:hypothetical protein
MEQTFPEKLTCPQLVKKFPAFYWARRSITTFTRAHPTLVPVLGQIDPVHPPPPPSLTSTLMLSSHLRLGFPSASFHRFLTKPLQAPLLSAIRALIATVFFICSPEWYLARSAEHKALRYVVLSTTLLPRPSGDRCIKVAISETRSRCITILCFMSSRNVSPVKYIPSRLRCEPTW